MDTIKTNFHWRDFKYRDEVPAKVLAEQFNHLEEEDAIDGFFKYRGWWYHVSDFLRLENAMLIQKGWQGYHADSYFSGRLLRVSNDGERYQVATYIT